MPTTPIALLNLAKEIAAGCEEQHKRSAVSRAYYAAYHGCKSWCEALPGVASIGGGPEGGVHQKLINQLQNPAPEVECAATRKMSKLLGARLQVFKTQRTKSDYFLDEAHPFTEWAANTVVSVEQMLSQMQPAQQSLTPEQQVQDALAVAAVVVPVEPQQEAFVAVAARPTLKRVK